MYADRENRKYTNPSRATSECRGFYESDEKIEIVEKIPTRENWRGSRNQELVVIRDGDFGSDRFSSPYERENERSRREKRRKELDCGHHSKDTFYQRIYFGDRFAELQVTKITSPSSFTAVGQVVIFTYAITNLGTADLDHYMQLYDSLLGGELVPFTRLDAGATMTTQRNYTVTERDVNLGTIKSTCRVIMNLRKHAFLCSPIFVSEITKGNAKVFVDLSFIYQSPTVIATITVINSSSSQVPTNGSFLTLSLPPNSNNYLSANPALSVGTSTISLTVPNLVPGASYVANFTFTPTGPSRTSYDFVGTLSGTSVNPLIGGNNVNASVIPF